MKHRGSPMLCRRAKVSAIRRHVDKFEFYSVGIAEEDGVVAFTIRRIIGWRIKHCCPDLEQQLVEKVNIFAAVGMPSHMMQPGRVAVMHTLSAGAFGLHQAYRCEVSTERRQLPIEAASILTNAPISHEAKDGIIEG